MLPPLVVWDELPEDTEELELVLDEEALLAEVLAAALLVDVEVEADVELPAVVLEAAAVGVAAAVLVELLSVDVVLVDPEVDVLDEASAELCETPKPKSANAPAVATATEVVATFTRVIRGRRPRGLLFMVQLFPASLSRI